MRSRIPLKGYLSLHFGAVAILPVVIIFFLVWFFVMPAMQTRTTIQHQTMARAIAGQISAYLEGGTRQLTALAESLQKRGIGSDQNVVDLLDAQCGSGAFFEALFVVDSQNLVVKTVGLARSRRTNRADYIGLDFSGRSFAGAVKLLKTAFWSQTFLSTVSSRMAVALIVPLGDDFMVGEITLGNLSEFISLLPLEAELVTLVIDAGGLIVADSQRRRSGQVLSVDFSSANEPLGDNLPASSTFQLDGVEMLGTAVQMSAVGWKVLFAQPVKKAFQPLRNTFALIGLGMAIALGLALFIAWLLAGHLTDLFASFTDKAQSIASGRYHLHWPSARTREFFQLGQSLQRMAEKINRREKSLVDSEQRLKDLVTNVPGVVYQYKADPHALESSSFTSVMQERSVEIFGLEAEEEKFFNDFMACLPEEDQSRFAMSVKDALETVSPWYYEGRFTKPSGEEIWFEGRSVPRRIDGELVYYGVLTDITRRKEMESSLRLARFIIDRANVGIYRIDPEGRIREVNQKAAELLGYTKKELESLTMADIDPLVARSSWRSNWQQVTALRVRNLEAQHRRKDGSVIPVEVHSNLLKYEGKQYAIAFVQDISERKRIEESLRLTQFIFDKAPIGIWRMGPEGEILDVNEQGCASLGYTREELCRMIVFDFAPGYGVDIWETNTDQLREAETITIEAQHQRKSGDIFPIQVISKLMRFKGQEHHLAFVQDISERKRMEYELKESEQRLDLALAGANEGIWDLRVPENTLYLDTRYYTMAGYQPNAFPSTVDEVMKRIHKDDVDQVKRINEQNVAGHLEVFEVEFRFLRQDGSYMWIQTKGRVVARDEKGNPTRFSGTNADITERKQAEEMLRRLQNYLSNIIDSMPSILVAVDLDGNVTQWNFQTEKTTGLSVDDARYQPLARVFPRLAGEAERIRTSIRERRVIKSSKVSRQVEQDVRFEDITIFPLVANGVEGAVIRVDDVTGQVRMEEMMVQSEKMLSVGGLAAGMAHEINNPLAGILQNVSVLENRLLGDLPANRKAAETAGITLPAIRHYLELRKLPGMIESIRTSGGMAAAIVKNMLSFARKSEKSVGRHDLSMLLDQSIDLLKTDYDMKKNYDFKQVQIIRQYDAMAQPVVCESSKIQQVFMNILKNGAEAMAETADLPDPPTFTLRIQDDGTWVRVEIEDNGPGLDEKTRRRIFEPFFTTKPVGKGTGLGLSVSYFIITEDHGGEMAVHTAARGGGTCFVIRLPKGGAVIGDQ